MSEKTDHACSVINIICQKVVIEVDFEVPAKKSVDKKTKEIGYNIVYSKSSNQIKNQKQKIEKSIAMAVLI